MPRTVLFLCLAVGMSAAACAAPQAPSPPSGELIAVGGGPGGAVDACFTCHGFRGEGDGLAPRLAGLSAGYLIKQLDDYADERRRDPDMTGVARRLADADRQAVASYYADMALPPSGIADAALPELFVAGDADRDLRACAECHGPDARGDGQAYPALAGQPATYLQEQLHDWRRGERWNDPRNVMSDVARRLTDEEIESLATRLASLGP